MISRAGIQQWRSFTSLNKVFRIGERTHGKRPTLDEVPRSEPDWRCLRRLGMTPGALVVFRAQKFCEQRIPFVATLARCKRLRFRLARPSALSPSSWVAERARDSFH